MKEHAACRIHSIKAVLLCHGVELSIRPRHVRSGHGHLCLLSSTHFHFNSLSRRQNTDETRLQWTRMFIITCTKYLTLFCVIFYVAHGTVDHHHVS